MCNHGYLPTKFRDLVENALVYTAGFVADSTKTAVSRELVRNVTSSSFDENYHLLTLNMVALVIPSQGTVKLLRAEILELQHSNLQRCQPLHTLFAKTLEKIRHNLTLRVSPSVS